MTTDKISLPTPDAPALECEDLSSPSAGDLSPSNVVTRANGAVREPGVVVRAALGGAAWVTSHPSGQSGDQSPHSKAYADATALLRSPQSDGGRAVP